MTVIRRAVSSTTGLHVQYFDKLLHRLPGGGARLDVGAVERVHVPVEASERNRVPVRFDQGDGRGHEQKLERLQKVLGLFSETHSQLSAIFSSIPFHSASFSFFAISRARAA